MSAADSQLPTPAADLLICYKNNAGAVAGVAATLRRVPSCSRAQTGRLPAVPPLPRSAVQAGAECRRQQAGALSLHVSDKGLHQLDQRLLTLRADLGERGGLALRRGKDASSRGAGGSPAEVAGEAGEESALQKKKPLMRPCGPPLRAAPGTGGLGPLGHPGRQGPPPLLPTLS